MAASGRSREVIRSALSMASSLRAGPFCNSSAMKTYRTRRQADRDIGGCDRHRRQDVARLRPPVFGSGVAN
jgi:hypothetical protein